MKSANTLCFDRPELGVSVLMPVHNGGSYLNAAVESILQQEAVLLELLIIDDHSTDSALRQLPADIRIKLIQSPDKGIVAALNAGLNEARYPFIARMDADDIAAKSRLRLQLTHFQDCPNLDICGTKVKMFNTSNDVASGYRHYENWINRLCDADQIEKEFFIESAIPHPTAMLRRKFLQSLGGYHDTDWPEDYDLWCRALLAGAIFGKPAAAELLMWRDHGQRLSRTDQRYNKQAFLRCKAYYLSRYLQQQGIGSCCIWGTGPTGLKMHDYLSDNGMLVSGFVDVNPRMKGRMKRHKPVHIAAAQPTDFMDDFCPDQGSIIVIAVSARGAREQIRSYLLRASLSETEDFIFAA